MFKVHIREMLVNSQSMSIHSENVSHVANTACGSDKHSLSQLIAYAIVLFVVNMLWQKLTLVDGGQFCDCCRISEQSVEPLFCAFVEPGAWGGPVWRLCIFHSQVFDPCTSTTPSEHSQAHGRIHGLWCNCTLYSLNNIWACSQTLFIEQG